jgi:8-oxo-dGTP pyrophosphatase MutT (NUDIX family)
VSFLDRIAECNNAPDLRGYREFRVAGRCYGRVRPAFAARLAAFGDVFVVDGDAVALAPRLTSFDDRSAAVDEVLHALVADGVVPGWRGEMYPVCARFADPPVMQIERAAIPLFGVRSWGVHINGAVRRGGAVTHMWIARRARDKPTYPGMLDNFVAGGQPIGLGLMENVIKECGEEAGVPPEIAARAVPVGAISYRHEMPDGFKPDVQFVWDLELPSDFTPHPVDGEIEAFHLWPVEEVIEATRDTAGFKFNCALVNIDFFVRHGLIAPDHPDYLEIISGLHR